MYSFDQSLFASLPLPLSFSSVRSRWFNLHLLRLLLLLPHLVYFSVLANVEGVVFGPFFASTVVVVVSHIERTHIYIYIHTHTHIYISSTIRKRPTDGEKEKNERKVKDYVYVARTVTLHPSTHLFFSSLCLLYNSGGSRCRRRRRHRRRSERDIFAQ